MNSDLEGIVLRICKKFWNLPCDRLQVLALSWSECYYFTISHLFLRKNPLALILILTWISSSLGALAPFSKVSLKLRPSIPVPARLLRFNYITKYQNQSSIYFKFFVKKEALDLTPAMSMMVAVMSVKWKMSVRGNFVPAGMFGPVIKLIFINKCD